MPTRSSKKQPGGRLDFAQNALRMVQEATGQIPKSEPEEHHKNPAAVALGKLGGAKGGKARAAKLSPKKRSAIAKKAAKARWDK
jgi:hypothetical protein